MHSVDDDENVGTCAAKISTLLSEAGGRDARASANLLRSSDVGSRAAHAERTGDEPDRNPRRLFGEVWVASGQSNMHMLVRPNLPWRPASAGFRDTRD